MLRINQATYLSLLVGFILAVRLSNSLWRSDILLFLEFIDIVSILFCNFTEFITFLCTFLVSFLFCFVVVVVVVFFFFLYKDYMILPISFSRFSGVLPAFTCARTIGELWRICFRVNILRPFPCFESYAASCTILK